MKKYLISKEGQFYKANLHCHTTVSDGVMTPQEVKDYYKERGYSVVAITDRSYSLASLFPPPAAGKLVAHGRYDR